MSNPGIKPLLFLFDIHTKLFPNAIEGISGKDSVNRMGTKANHVAWLAGSLVHQRFDIANLLGSEMKDTANELFKDFKGLQENADYPSLDTYIKDWEKISPPLKELLESVTDKKLESIYDMGEMKVTHFDMIGWSVHREAYLIGQLGLWRRLMGYDAMKYPM